MHQTSSSLNVGIIGCGAISDAYLKGCPTFPNLRIIHLADLDPARAKAKAEAYGIAHHGTVDSLLANEAVDLVINLTIPLAHTEVNLAALHAGKHVYCEKPLCIRREERFALQEAAHARHLLIGSAPDTFLGDAHQTCRKLIDEGAIGTPLSAVAFMTCPGHERWHPSPAFYYDIGGGPMFDMGPYYLTALVNLLGPMRRIGASTGAAYAQRTITSQPLHGTRIEVKTPTHLTGAIDFESGVIATMIMSFDVWHTHLPQIEIYGSEGSLQVPDPNHASGTILLRRKDDREWRDIAPTHPRIPARGAGVADLAEAILQQRAARASSDLAFHVVDAMQAFEESSTSGCHIALTTRCERPAPLPAL